MSIDWEWACDGTRWDFDAERSKEDRDESCDSCRGYEEKWECDLERLEGL
jgi:hypothetical protein